MTLLCLLDQTEMFVINDWQTYILERSSKVTRPGRFIQTILKERVDNKRPCEINYRFSIRNREWMISKVGEINGERSRKSCFVYRLHFSICFFFIIAKKKDIKFRYREKVSRLVTKLKITFWENHQVIIKFNDDLWFADLLGIISSYYRIYVNY